MQLTSILTIAILALGIAAHPNMGSRNSNPSCHGEQVYNDAHKRCECTPDKDWDDHKQKCCHKPVKKPECPEHQNPYCSKDRDHWCKYDENEDYCEDNGYNSAWCYEEGHEEEKLHEHYPDDKPHCKGKQKYCPDEKKCVCPKPMYWNDKDEKCHYHAIEKPHCEEHQEPYCGRSKHAWCHYDEDDERCEDDGKCYAWCSVPADVDGAVQSIFDLD